MFTASDFAPLLKVVTLAIIAMVVVGTLVGVAIGAALF